MSSPSRSSQLPDVDPAQAAAMLDNGTGLLLDVREPDEWAAGHAPQARHVPLGQLDPDALRSTGPVIAVCRSGNRSSRAAELLATAGVPVHNLAGGMKAWAAAGQPVHTDDGEAGTVA